MTLSVPDPMPTMSAAGEVAAYLIISEALTNVARHAGCDTAEVTISVDRPMIVIMIWDHGSARAWAPGIGLASMRERAEQLGHLRAAPTATAVGSGSPCRSAEPPSL